MKKHISKKIQEYLQRPTLPSLDKKEVAEILTQELLADPKFKKNLHLNTLADIKDEIRDEVFEILQKKTYGHFSLKEYLDSKINKNTGKSK